MQSRFLQAFRPFIAITPNIGKPTREVSFNEKLFWTSGAFVIYFLMASIPIIGADIGEGDPFAFIRTITASTYGSLAEIGVGAIVTAGLIMQVLVGLKIIKVDLEDSEERSLYNGAQKVISLVLTIIASPSIMALLFIFPSKERSIIGVVDICVEAAGISVIVEVTAVPMLFVDNI